MGCSLLPLWWKCSGNYANESSGEKTCKNSVFTLFGSIGKNIELVSNIWYKNWLVGPVLRSILRVPFLEPKMKVTNLCAGSTSCYSFCFLVLVLVQKPLKFGISVVFQLHINNFSVLLIIIHFRDDITSSLTDGLFFFFFYNRNITLEPKQSCCQDCDLCVWSCDLSTCVAPQSRWFGFIY